MPKIKKTPCSIFFKKLKEYQNFYWIPAGALRTWMSASKEKISTPCSKMAKLNFFVNPWFCIRQRKQMDTILNITNGDSAVRIMKKAGIPGRFFPWRDVLHEGPVPADLSLEKLSEIRAEFIIDQGWGDSAATRNSFIKRDRELHEYRKYSKVILWFEHDLYDQLQILQILDWFSEKPSEDTHLAIVCTEQYLGLAAPEQLKSLLKFEAVITDKHLILAKKAWSAFRSPFPDEWLNLLNKDTSALPFLNGAILRLLEEYPSCKNGLSRTAQIALEIISKGEKRPGRIFGKYQNTEERRFMGDSSFWSILQQLLRIQSPIVTVTTGKATHFTDRPRSGAVDHIGRQMRCWPESVIGWICLYWIVGLVGFI